MTIAGRRVEPKMSDFSHLNFARTESPKPRLDRRERRILIEGGKNVRQLHDSHMASASTGIRLDQPIQEHARIH